ncbi:uncharacterized protein LOC121776805 [Salvia splendens]|uniref:uncharacterized protein LOC121776805 n=1 Tax=Salvia splendens TaxID=180675 RepID=UPI001C26E6A9|nr:uncharacterized protein LOC121776805 [Salvia splendens]
MGETTSRQVLRQFCRSIHEIFGLEYLRKTSTNECQRLIDMHGRVHSFPLMMGSIDYMHWDWRNRHVALNGQFTSGFKGKHPSMILEAIANYLFRIWHAYFGVVGSNNDINVLQSSHLFNNECRGEGPEVKFVANDMKYNRAYYLADDIYPRWPVFIKTIRQPVGPKKSYSARRERLLGRMLSELLVYSKHDGPLYGVRHEFGMRMMSLTSCMHVSYCTI